MTFDKNRREEMKAAPFTGLIHCFTGSQALADAAQLSSLADETPAGEISRKERYLQLSAGRKSIGRGRD